MKSIPIILAAILLSGCSFLQQVSESEVAVRIGVAEYIDRDPQTAADVYAWSNEVLGQLDGTLEEIALSRLRSEAEDRIPWDELSPGQEILAFELLEYVQREIESRIDAGVVGPNEMGYIRDIVQTVRDQSARHLR